MSIRAVSALSRCALGIAALCVTLALLGSTFSAFRAPARPASASTSNAALAYATGSMRLGHGVARERERHEPAQARTRLLAGSVSGRTADSHDP